MKERKLYMPDYLYITKLKAIRPFRVDNEHFATYRNGMVPSLFDWAVLHNKMDARKNYFF